LRRAEDRPLTICVDVLRDERHATKLVQRELGCSPSQADRIVKTGRAPADLREKFIEFLKRVRDRRLERAKALHEEIVLLEYRASVEARRKASSSETGGSP
jgi:AraC-like DNA-binding protein